MKDARIAAIGENDVMLIFKAIGADIYPVQSADEAGSILTETVKSGEYGIVFITESIAEKIDDIIVKYSARVLPTVLVIPGLGEKNQYALSRLKKAIIKAVGTDIISQKE